MTLDHDYLNFLLDELENHDMVALEPLLKQAEGVLKSATRVGLSWSGSSLGHHAKIYYGNFEQPPSGRRFNAEWGTIMGMPPGWSERNADDVTARIETLSGINLAAWQESYESTLSELAHRHAAILLELTSDDHIVGHASKLLSNIESLVFDDQIRRKMIASELRAYHVRMSRDSLAVSVSGIYTPSHVFYEALAQEVRSASDSAKSLLQITRLIVRNIRSKEPQATESEKRSAAMLGQLANNPFTLIKPDGTRVQFFGNLSGNKLITFTRNLPVDEGDSIERILPNDSIEIFIVDDRGFMSRFHDIPDHYQMKVHKYSKGQDAPVSTQPGHVTNVYNLQGPNTRVNIQSADQSYNVSNIGESDLFRELRNTIKSEILDEPQKTKLLEQVVLLEKTAGTKLFGETFQQFMALAANCMTVLSPFLPALVQLVTSSRH